jgi:hypothetical protein
LIKRLIGLACCIASTGFAQSGGGYLGPAVLSSGATGVGNRGGQLVDLRFYAGVNGVYDSSIQPVSVNSKGDLVTINGLYGADANVGVYGSHSWKTSSLGVDYRGVFRAYADQSDLDGIDQFLSLGYTWQESRRLILKAQLGAGITSDGLGIGGIPQATANTLLTPTTLLFDDRSYWAQAGVDATLVQTARTDYTFGGSAFEVWRQSADLVGVEGWSARGSVEHRISKNTSVGFTYQRQHFEFPKVFGQSNVDTAQLFMGTNLGRWWRLTVMAGVFHAEISGLQEVALSPAIAALLGQTSTIQSFYNVTYAPSGQVALTRAFRSASLSFSYSQLVSPGNGVYLTSKSDNGGVTYTYSGIRKVGLNVSGGYSSLVTLGQQIAPYQTAFAGAGVTYTLPASLHLVGRYDYRYQQIENLTYKHTGSRVTVGLTWSPGKVPLSLW